VAAASQLAALSIDGTTSVETSSALVVVLGDRLSQFPVSPFSKSQ